MTADIRHTRANFIAILDRVLDKGVLVDAAMSISLAGIDLISVEARVFIASCDTYLTSNWQTRATRAPDALRFITPSITRTRRPRSGSASTG